MFAKASLQFAHVVCWWCAKEVRGEAEVPWGKSKKHIYVAIQLVSLVFIIRVEHKLSPE